MTTNLQILRKKSGISQSELSKKSGVSIRMIQKYETGEKDINKAAVITVYQLAMALDTMIENLLDMKID